MIPDWLLFILIQYVLHLIAIGKHDQRSRPTHLHQVKDSCRYSS